MKYKTGLILGKFMPPHKGHMHLIDHGLARTERLTVLVCSLQREPIPGDRRYRWVKQLYPDVDVRHVTDEVPSYPHEDPLNFWNIWISLLRRYFPTGPDVVFTSEDYGDELAQRLGAVHEPVDIGRRQVPVSGTAIRERPMENWDHLPEVVRLDFARRVSLVGAESTGKTTLARALAEHYRTVWVPEFARSYLEPRGNACLIPDIINIAHGQATLEDVLAEKANRLLVCDTDLLLTCAWSKRYLGACPQEVERMAQSRRYALTFLCDLDLPWVPDELRNLESDREGFHHTLLDALTDKRQPHLLVSGPHQQRLATAIRAIDPLLKDPPLPPQ